MGADLRLGTLANRSPHQATVELRNAYFIYESLYLK
jgi:hypothetical protein